MATNTQSYINALWALDPKSFAVHHAKISDLQAAILQSLQHVSATEHAAVNRESTKAPDQQKDPMSLQSRFSSPHYPSPVVPDIPPAHHEWKAAAQRPSYRTSTKSSVVKVSTRYANPSKRQPSSGRRATVAPSAATSRAPLGESAPDASAPELEENVFGKLLKHLTGLHDRAFYATPASDIVVPELECLFGRFHRLYRNFKETSCLVMIHHEDEHDYGIEGGDG